MFGGVVLGEFLVPVLVAAGAATLSALSAGVSVFRKRKLPPRHGATITVERNGVSVRMQLAEDESAVSPEFVARLTAALNAADGGRSAEEPAPQVASEPGRAG